MDKQKLKLQLNITRLVTIMLAAILIIIFRYGYLQLVQGSELSERMRYQVGQDYLVQSPRGAILDCNGRELAASTMTKSLFVDPSNVSDALQLANDLSPLIRKPVNEILDDIAVGGGFAWVKRRLEHAEYEAVRKLIRDKDYFSCLGFRDEAKRYYPNDVLAANVLGFVGTDDKGLDGVEQAFDKYIKGEVTESFLYTDTRERPILLFSTATVPAIMKFCNIYIVFCIGNVIIFATVNPSFFVVCLRFFDDPQFDHCLEN